MNDIKKLRRLMRAAHAMQKSNPVILRGVPITQSQAVKYAWWFEGFRKQLQNGIYDFSYIKTDGSIREARGTLCLDLIPKEHRPKTDGSTAKEPAPGIFTYYDFFADGDKGGWRSFKCENFIGFITQV